MSYIWNEYHILPADVYNRDKYEKEFIYQATELAIDARNKAMKGKGRK